MKEDRISTSVAAHGRWPEILTLLGLGKFLSGEHGRCPNCGGKDRFRFDDRNKDGDYFCNQCGAGKGIKLLMIVNKWTYQEACKAVDELLRTNWCVSMAPSNRPKLRETRVPKSTRDCALWLRKLHPEKLEPWLESHSPEVRWWLETQV